MVIMLCVCFTVMIDFKWYHPTGVAIARTNEIFVTDLHRVVRIDSSGSSHVVVGSKTAGDEDMLCPDMGTRMGSAKMKGSRQLDASIAASANGNTTGSNVGNTANGGASSGAAGSSSGAAGSSSLSSSSSSVDSCIFNTPTGLDVDDDNSLIYVVDSGNNAIRMVMLMTSPASVVTVAQDPLLNTPYGVVLLPAQNAIYVTSFGGHYVLRMDVSDPLVFPLTISTSNIYAGSSSGVFGHADGSLVASIFMYPTGITADDANNLYLNEWYMLPGEVDMGSQWASAYGVSSGMSVGSSSTGTDGNTGNGSGSGGKSKHNSGSGGNVFGSIGKSAKSPAGSGVGSSATYPNSMSVPSGQGMQVDLYPGGTSKTVYGSVSNDPRDLAGTASVAGSNLGSGSMMSGGKSGSGGSSGSASGSSGSASGSSGSASGSSGSGSSDTGNGNSNSPYHTTHLKSVNWGHEPQYLHNVRKIVTLVGSEEVMTIAGSIIRKYCLLYMYYCMCMCMR